MLDDDTRRAHDGIWRHLEPRDGVLLRDLVPDDAGGVLSVHGDERIAGLIVAEAPPASARG